jgi:hypothetical protein
LGISIAGSLVVRFLFVMWTIKQARPYAVVFAVLAPLAIALHPIWLMVLWRPSKVRAWSDSNPDLAKKYDDGVDRLYREFGLPTDASPEVATLGEAMVTLEGRSSLALVVLN